MGHLKDRTDPMRRLLNAYELNSGEALAAVIGVSASTAYKRIKHVEDFSVAELRRLNKRGHIPIEELRAAL